METSRNLVIRAKLDNKVDFGTKVISSCNALSLEVVTVDDHAPEWLVTLGRGVFILFDNFKDLRIDYRTSS